MLRTLLVYGVARTEIRLLCCFLDVGLDMVFCTKVPLILSLVYMACILRIWTGSDHCACGICIEIASLYMLFMQFIYAILVEALLFLGSKPVWNICLLVCSVAFTVLDVALSICWSTGVLMIFIQ